MGIIFQFLALIGFAGVVAIIVGAAVWLWRQLLEAKGGNEP